MRYNRSFLPFGDKDKVPLADLVYKIYQDKKRIELTPLNSKTAKETFKEFMAQKEFPRSTDSLYETMWYQLWECYPEFKFDEFTLNHWMNFRSYHLVNTGKYC